MDGLTPTTFIFLWVEVLKTNIEKHHHPIAKIYKFYRILIFLFQSLVYITFEIYNLIVKGLIISYRLER